MTRGILCCGLRRSGSTLIANLVGDVLRGGIVEETRPAPTVSAWVSNGVCDFGFTTREKFLSAERYFRDDVDAVLVKGHMYYPDISKKHHEVFNKFSLAIMSYRNMLDIAASSKLLHSRKGLTLDIKAEVEAILNEYHKWTSFPGLKKLRYEKFHSDIIGLVREIADFIGVYIDEQAIWEIGQYRTEKSTKSRMIGDGRNAITHGRNHFGKVLPGSYKSILSKTEVLLVSSIASGYQKGNGYL